MARETVVNGKTSPQWLADLKATAAAMRDQRVRPSGYPFGRWLGDFLDQDTASGLLPAEEMLLLAAVNGEPCVLESRAARLWAAFDDWRLAMPEAAAELIGFAASMTVMQAAPEAMQEVFVEAKRHAMQGLGLPQDWEPKDAGDVEKFALAQRSYLARLKAEAAPEKTIADAKTDTGFYQLAVETVIQALSPEPSDTNEKIETQPRVLREFFGELVCEVKRAPEDKQAFLSRLKADPAALKEGFAAAFARFEREAWRWVDPADPEVRIRADFLRFLALGGDNAAPVHESRLELWNAYIPSDLDLSGGDIPQRLVFRCRFEGMLSLRDSFARSIELRKSRVRCIKAENIDVSGAVLLDEGFRSEECVSFLDAKIASGFWMRGGTFLSKGSAAVDCEGAQITGDVFLDRGFLGEGGALFSSAKVGGDLNCAGGVFRNPTKDGSGSCLDCDDAEIAGNVVLAENFRSEGSISFRGAQIGGALNCEGGTFLNWTSDGVGEALDFAYSEIDEDVSFGSGSCAEGAVSFYKAHVKGNFSCTGGRFDNASPDKRDGSRTWTPKCATAIDLQGTTINGTLWLGPDAEDGLAKAEINGSVNLHGCYAHEIIDHPSSWPSTRVQVASGKTLPAFISLDGFTYDRMTGAGDYETATRKRWLDRQPPRQLGLRFRPQPFEQLIKVYRDMGHERPAREISKFKERRRYRSLFIKLWYGWRHRPEISQRLIGAKVAHFAAPLDWLAWPAFLAARVVYRSTASILLAFSWAFVGLGTAYWYGWGRLSVFLLALWIAGGFFYRHVALQGGFAPSNPVIYLNEKLEGKCSNNWTACKDAPPELPSFSAFTYSLDNMLPLLDLGQKRDWQPIDRVDPQVQIDLPTFTWLSVNDLRHSEITGIEMKPQPLGEGTLDVIVRAQTLASWAALGLLVAMLSGLVKRD